MKRNETKDTVAVLLHIPKKLYDEYLTTLNERSLKRQSYGAKLFCEAIQKDMDEYRKETAPLPAGVITYQEEGTN